jgi:hypothetical protein
VCQIIARHWVSSSMLSPPPLASRVTGIPGSRDSRDSKRLENAAVACALRALEDGCLVERRVSDAPRRESTRDRAPLLKE